MFRLISFGALCCMVMVPTIAISDTSGLIEVSPNMSDFASLWYSSDFTCVRLSNGKCYYCGTSSSCPCETSEQIKAGSSLQINTSNEASIGCLGTNFCVAPANGILSFKDGNTTNTEYRFYGYTYDSTAHCRRALTPSVVGSWATQAYTFNGYPFCRALSVNNSAVNNKPCSCDKGYYSYEYSGRLICHQCPSMTDADGVERYGTTSYVGATSITDCKMGSEYTFSDDTGLWHFEPSCSYSE